MKLHFKSHIFEDYSEIKGYLETFRYQGQALEIELKANYNISIEFLAQFKNYLINNQNLVF